jgi:hypothetical protein
LGAFAVEGFNKALTAYVPVPPSGEVLVLGVQAGIEHIVVALYRAGVLLDADVIISPVVRNETDSQTKRIAQLETHLRVAHEVAVLFAVVRDREASQSKGAGFRYPTIPSTFPLSLPFAGRPNLSAKR